MSDEEEEDETPRIDPFYHLDLKDQALISFTPDQRKHVARQFVMNWLKERLGFAESAATAATDLGPKTKNEAWMTALIILTSRKPELFGSQVGPVFRVENVLELQDKIVANRQTASSNNELQDIELDWLRLVHSLFLSIRTTEGIEAIHLLGPTQFPMAQETETASNALFEQQSYWRALLFAMTSELPETRSDYWSEVSERMLDGFIRRNWFETTKGSISDAIEKLPTAYGIESIILPFVAVVARRLLTKGGTDGRSLFPRRAVEFWVESDQTVFYKTPITETEYRLWSDFLDGASRADDAKPFLAIFEILKVNAKSGISNWVQDTGANIYLAEYISRLFTDLVSSVSSAPVPTTYARSIHSEISESLGKLIPCIEDGTCVPFKPLSADDSEIFPNVRRGQSAVAEWIRLSDTSDVENKWRKVFENARRYLVRQYPTSSFNSVKVVDYSEKIQPDFGVVTVVVASKTRNSTHYGVLHKEDQQSQARVVWPLLREEYKVQNATRWRFQGSTDETPSLNAVATLWVVEMLFSGFTYREIADVQSLIGDLSVVGGAWGDFFLSEFWEERANDLSGSI